MALAHQAVSYRVGLRVGIGRHQRAKGAVVTGRILLAQGGSCWPRGRVA